MSDKLSYSEEQTRLMNLLDDQYNWPDYFNFKFILKDKTQVPEFNTLFGAENISSRDSKTGKYASLTCRKLITSSEEIVALYLKTSKINGVMTL